MIIPWKICNFAVVKVIQTTSLIGRGTKEDPVRFTYQYWDFKGNLLAKNDTIEN